MASCAPEILSGSGVRRPLIAILGPTAVGKSDLAVDLCRRFGGDLLNADSRQVYREMEIGTAKPTAAERAVVPHRLFDLVTPDQAFSAGDYERLGRQELEQTWNAGRIPVLCGGTGFYYDALVHGLPETHADPELRVSLDDRFQQDGLPGLIDELRRLDPAGAETIDLANPRRVIRALEIILTSGKPLHEARSGRSQIQAALFPIVVTIPRDRLAERISQRVAAMISRGLQFEVEALIKRYGWDAPGLQTIGYREWKPFFEGVASIEQVAEEISLRTRQYAKRQETWFRRRPGCPVRDISCAEQVAGILKDVERFLAV